MVAQFIRAVPFGAVNNRATVYARQSARPGSIPPTRVSFADVCPTGITIIMGCWDPEKTIDVLR
jgi:hypothetical protein